MESTSEQIESLSEELAGLRAEIERVENFSNGVFCALSDLLMTMTKRQPETVAALVKTWQPVAQAYAGFEHPPQSYQECRETPELLEARNMLYERFRILV